MSGVDFAVVLAAGRSRRMGTDKAGMEWVENQTLLEWTVTGLQSGGWFPIVVIGPHNPPAWALERSDLKLVCNARADEGKTSSIAVGVAALPEDTQRILIVCVDQPRPAELYRNLKRAVAEHPALIVVPDKHGRSGHPILFDGAMGEQLLTLRESTWGLRGLLDEFAHAIYRMPCDPDWLVWDCNTPADYRAAKAWFEARHKLHASK
jgi:molybdenum cofactor cytidylyltransferase